MLCHEGLVSARRRPILLHPMVQSRNIRVHHNPAVPGLTDQPFRKILNSQESYRADVCFTVQPSSAWWVQVVDEGPSGSLFKLKVRSLSLASHKAGVGK